MVVYPSKKRYDAENTVKVMVTFNRRTDPEATARIEREPRRAEYIRKLVREDIKRESGQEDNRGKAEG